MAIEHHELEKTYSQSLISRSHSVNTDEFFDCDDMNGIGKLTCKAYFTTVVVLVDSVDQDQTAQNVQPDL